MKQNSENIYKQVVELALAGYWDWDIPSGNAYLSPTFKELLGYEDAEIPNKIEALQKIVRQEDIDGLLVKVKRHWESKGRVPYYSEVPLFHKNGSVVWMITVGKVVEWGDKGNEPKRMVGCFIDITERKKAEEKLDENTEQLRALSDNIPGGLVYQIDSGCDGRERKFTYISGGVQQLHEVSVADVLKDATRIYEQIFEEDRPRLAELEERAFKNMTVCRVEARCRLPSGEIRWRLFTSAPRRLSNNHVVWDGVEVDITERKKAEEKLDENATRLRALSDNLPGGMVYQVDTGCDGQERRFTYISGGVRQLHEMSVEDVLNDPTKLYDQYVEEDCLRVAKLEELAIKSMTVFSTEARFRLPSGKMRWGLLTSAPHRLSNNHVVWNGVEIDITDRKMIDEVLIESESRLRAFMDNMPSMVVVKDDELRPRFFNRAFLEHFPGHEWLNKTPHETFPKEVADSMQKADLQAIRDEFVSYEEKWSDKNGIERTLETRKFAIDRGSKPPYLGVIITDISERKRAEEALAAEKERLAVTLRSIGDGVITTDTKGIILTVNKAAEVLTGWTQDEARGKPLSEVFVIINEITRQKSKSPVERIIQSESAVELSTHTMLISRDGRKALIAYNGAPIRDKDGKVSGVVLVFLNVTEQQKLMESAQRADKLEAIGVLAGGIAHDFNNLLGGIFGYIDMALSSSDPSNVERYLNASLNTITRARGLTQQLLTFSKGGIPNRKIERLFPFVQETVQFAMSGSSVSCSFSVPQDLWLCNIDRGQIGQVIDNLVLNAQQAMPLGGSIDVMARNISLVEKAHPLLEAGDYVQISIRDHGIGMPKEILPRIFDPFFTTKPRGHGLGLSTCYSIISRHGGCMDVESESGIGSTFHIYLPAAKNAMSSDVVEAVVSLHKGSGTIVVMDDEKVIRDVVAAMLKSFGYTAVCKSNGRDALDFFEAEIKADRKVVAMIFDLTIPGGMGGKEAIDEIRKISKKIPVIVASGYAEDPIMANPEEYGFNASISKPFVRSEMAKVLNDLLKHKKK